jgi:hypothetical protein
MANRPFSSSTSGGVAWNGLGICFVKALAGPGAEIALRGRGGPLKLLGKMYKEIIILELAQSDGGAEIKLHALTRIAKKSRAVSTSASIV